jgi:hypothetical protein
MSDTVVSSSGSETLDSCSSSHIPGTYAALGDEGTVHMHAQGIPLFVTPVSTRPGSIFFGLSRMADRP